MAAVPRPDVGLVLALEIKKRRKDSIVVKRRVGASYGSNLAMLRLQAWETSRKYTLPLATLSYNQQS